MEIIWGALTAIGTLASIYSAWLSFRAARKAKESENKCQAITDSINAAIGSSIIGQSATDSAMSMNFYGCKDITVAPSPPPDRA